MRMNTVPSLALVYEDPFLLVVDKPELLPTVPLKNDPSDKPTLLGLVAQSFPEVLSVEGKNAWEGGVLHRLDTPTSGLVVIARTKEAYTTLQAISKAELFVKEYRCRSSQRMNELLAGFPPFPYEDPVACGGREVTVGSLFRHYGDNRRQVRPVLPDSPKHLLEKSTGTFYLTKIWYTGQEGEASTFTCRLTSGFRHQVRVHMAWSGHPIDGDGVYHGMEQHSLALRSVAVEFPHPITSQPMEIRIDT